MKINQTKIRKTFSEEGIQIGVGTMDMINREILESVRRMAKRCKEGNLKRLTPELFYVALGKFNNGNS
jgi:hypothetical protein